MYQEDEERIRKRAYEIWEREGRPEGRADAHWDMAREEIAAKDNLTGTLMPNPATAEVDRTFREGPVEPLEAVENQGEFPGLTDQGEEAQYPQRRVRR
ncbi:MAG TPA: DUF2934 domain-containing protein [Azospirillaceae bacterium]|nr:DUF2934 domain-containing protein [Azospirillaceae bacterium]